MYTVHVYVHTTATVQATVYMYMYYMVDIEKGHWMWDKDLTFQKLSKHALSPWEDSSPKQVRTCKKVKLSYQTEHDADAK